MKLILKSILTCIALIITCSCSQTNVDNIKLKGKYPIPKIEFNPRHYICYKTDEKLVVDGVLDEKSWQKTTWSTNFIDIEGVKEPIHQTRVKMLWDEEYLYIGAELNEPHINASLKQRDTIIYYDNDFEIFIDPDGDTHNYFEFEINAFNTVWDLFMVKPYRNGGPAVTGWDIANLKSAVKIFGTINNPSDFDKKWTIEIGIPLKSLNYANKKTIIDNDIWRINFSRVQWQYEVVDGKYQKEINPKTNRHFPEYNWVWSPQGVINMHYPEMWGFLQFSQKIPGTETVTFSLSNDEKIKWDLRKIYYYQQIHYHNLKKYANKLEPLKKIGLSINKKESSIIFETTKSMFKISIPFGDKLWHINHEGKTWKTAILIP